MQRSDRVSLVGLLRASSAPHRQFSDELGSIRIGKFLSGEPQDPLLFADRSILVAPRRQLSAALALLSLDGIARRVVLCPAELADDDLAAVALSAEADCMVCDEADPSTRIPQGLACHVINERLLPGHAGARQRVETEWVLLTSGTTGRPKLVVHTLASLVGPLISRGAADDVVWSTFYDTRRYGGLQILLRAIAGGTSMCFSGREEPIEATLRRLGRTGVTNMSGTPSHWRKVLMSSAAAAFAPRYVRLSGETADQPILDWLSTAYPSARIVHAFASTEAGLAFEVFDRRAGMPAALITAEGGPAELCVREGTLHVRSPRIARGFLGPAARPVAGADGFVDTGDMVEQLDDRWYFRGRREGVINVGGQKVYPEEVEAVLNSEPLVAMSRAWARRSPITGSVVAADVVIHDTGNGTGAGAIRTRLLEACRGALAPHKVPATIRFVQHLDIAASGKLVRSGA